MYWLAGRADTLLVIGEDAAFRKRARDGYQLSGANVILFLIMGRGKRLRKRGLPFS